jgi:hypothetical protein
MREVLIGHTFLQQKSQFVTVIGVLHTGSLQALKGP